jgi:hypothetical protein
LVLLFLFKQVFGASAEARGSRRAGVCLLQMTGRRWFSATKDHASRRRLNAVHGIKDILMHTMHLHAQLEAVLLEQLSEHREIHVAVRDVHEHDHGEHFVHNVLGDIQNVDIALANGIGHLGDDAGSVLTDYSNHCTHIVFLQKGIKFIESHS